jgi:hypothetical protein
MAGKPTLFILLILICTTSVQAEMRSADSLELMVANADVIARARVVSVGPSVRPPFGRGSFEFRVDEQFKGPHAEKIMVETDGWDRNRIAELLVGTHGDALIFQLDPARFTPRNPNDRYQDELQRRAMVLVPLLSPSEADRTVKYLSQIPTMDFQVLSTGPQIIDGVRKALKFPSTRPTRWIQVVPPPNSPAWQALWAGSAVTIRAPVDSRLEALAHRWITEGNLSIAIDALRCFPSDTNAQILRRMFGATQYATSGAGRLSRVYYTSRLRAAKVLESWGYPQETPAAVLPDDLYRPVRWPLIVAIVFVVCVPGWFARRAMRPIRTVTLFSLLLTAMLGTLWLMSRRVVPELYWNGDATQVWLSPTHGWLQLTWITNCPLRLTNDHDSVVSLDTIIEPGFQRPVVRSAAAMPDPPARGLMFGVLPTEPLNSLWTQSPTEDSRSYLLANNGLLLGTQPETFTQKRQLVSLNVRFHRLQVHLAVLTALATIPLLTALVRLRTRRRRRRSNLCLECGYDLRGSTGRCPECGAEAPIGIRPEDSVGASASPI